MNLEKKDSITFLAEKAREYFSKTNEANEIFDIDIAYIEWDMQYGIPEIALDKIHTLLKDSELRENHEEEIRIYELLAHVYMILSRPKEALDSYDRMFMLKDKYNLDIRSYAITYLQRANAAHRTGEYKLSLSYCDSAKYYMEKDPKYNKQAL